MSELHPWLAYEWGSQRRKEGCTLSEAPIQESKRLQYIQTLGETEENGEKLIWVTMSDTELYIDVCVPSKYVNEVYNDLYNPTFTTSGSFKDSYRVLLWKFVLASPPDPHALANKSKSKSRPVTDDAVKVLSKRVCLRVDDLMRYGNGDGSVRHAKHNQPLQEFRKDNEVKATVEAVEHPQEAYRQASVVYAGELPSSQSQPEQAPPPPAARSQKELSFARTFQPSNSARNTIIASAFTSTSTSVGSASKGFDWSKAVWPSADIDYSKPSRSQQELEELWIGKKIQRVQDWEKKGCKIDRELEEKLLAKQNSIRMMRSRTGGAGGGRAVPREKEKEKRRDKLRPTPAPAAQAKPRQLPTPTSMSLTNTSSRASLGTSASSSHSGVIEKTKSKSKLAEIVEPSSPPPPAEARSSASPSNRLSQQQSSQSQTRSQKSRSKESSHSRSQQSRSKDSSTHSNKKDPSSTNGSKDKGKGKAKVVEEEAETEEEEAESEEDQEMHEGGGQAGVNNAVEWEETPTPETREAARAQELALKERSKKEKEQQAAQAEAVNRPQLRVHRHQGAAQEGEPEASSSDEEEEVSKSLLSQEQFSQSQAKKLNSSPAVIKQSSRPSTSTSTASTTALRLLNQTKPSQLQQSPSSSRDTSLQKISRPSISASASRRPTPSLPRTQQPSASFSVPPTTFPLPTAAQHNVQSTLPTASMLNEVAGEELGGDDTWESISMSYLEKEFPRGGQQQQPSSTFERRRVLDDNSLASSGSTIRSSSGKEKGKRARREDTGKENATGVDKKSKKRAKSSGESEKKVEKREKVGSQVVSTKGKEKAKPDEVSSGTRRIPRKEAERKKEVQQEEVDKFKKSDMPEQTIQKGVSKTKKRAHKINFLSSSPEETVSPDQARPSKKARHHYSPPPPDLPPPAATSSRLHEPRQLPTQFPLTTFSHVALSQTAEWSEIVASFASRKPSSPKKVNLLEQMERLRARRKRHEALSLSQMG